MTLQSRRRALLVFLALLFFAPLIAAAVLYFVKPEWIPSHRLNYGTLVEPARALPALGLAAAGGVPAPEALKGQWTLVYLGAATCDAACEERLVLTRQVRLALNKDRARVQRVYLAPGPAELEAARQQLAAAHPDLQFYFDGAAPGERAADFFRPTDPLAVYLVDPKGNWVMAYTGAIEHRGLHKDLKKLLRFG